MIEPEAQAKIRGQYEMAAFHADRAARLGTRRDARLAWALQRAADVAVKKGLAREQPHE